MELRHLRYFAAVAHYLNYSEASRRLHVAQPAISQTILDLEDELGVKLLLRTKRTVQLTAAGTAFLREALEILRRANEARRLAQRASRGEVGILGIGFSGQPLARFCLPWWTPIASNFPTLNCASLSWTLTSSLPRSTRAALTWDLRGRSLRTAARNSSKKRFTTINWPLPCPPNTRSQSKKSSG